MDQYEVLMKLCDEQMIPETSELLVKFSGESDQQKLTRRMSVTDLLRQAWLNPVTTLEFILGYFELSFNSDVIRSVAISKKYDGYIKRSDAQFEKIKKLETMKLNWEELASSKNISFECKQRITRVKPETFGQLKLIEGIRPATLAVVAARAL